MKLKEMLLVMGACLSLVGLVGCANHTSNTGQGAAPEQNAALTGAGEGQPEPVASPSFRPGMNRNDPRDPLFNSRPQPMTYPQPVAR